MSNPKDFKPKSPKASDAGPSKDTIPFLTQRVVLPRHDVEIDVQSYATGSVEVVIAIKVDAYVCRVMLPIHEWAAGQIKQKKAYDFFALVRHVDSSLVKWLSDPHEFVGKQVAEFRAMFAEAEKEKKAKFDAGVKVAEEARAEIAKPRLVGIDGQLLTSDARKLVGVG